MFVDASALVAILAREPGHEGLSQTLAAHGKAFTSPVAIWEATVRIVSLRMIEVESARQEVMGFLEAAKISEITIGNAETSLALEAFDRFGKGRHPARLNMGDCFAYACAKVHRVPLLYVGNDFAQTDVNEGF